MSTDNEEVGSIGDKLKGVFGRNNGSERVENVENLVEDPENWLNPREDSEKIFRKNVSPMVGQEIDEDVLRKRISDLEETAEDTYSQMLKKSPLDAEVYRETLETAGIGFNAEDAVKSRIDELVSKGSKKDFKDALAVAESVEYEITLSDQDKEVYESLDEFSENRDLVQQLSDKVFEDLEGEAAAFFDAARDESRPEGMHKSSAIEDADPADGYSSEEAVREMIEEAMESFENSEHEDIEDMVYDREDDIPEALSLRNQEEGPVKAHNLAYRFDLDEKEEYRDEALEALEETYRELENLKKDAEGFEETVETAVEKSPGFQGPDIGDSSEVISNLEAGQD